MKISVAMITYNHEAYIEQAVKSVLEQQVDFEYEIVIGDDVSTDRTREILLEFKNKYPQQIRLLLHENRLGPSGNLVEVLKNCSGELIALLEGDDYWTSPQKLKVQADFLDTNPECALCFHAVSIYSEDKRQDVAVPRRIWNDTNPEAGEKYTLEDVLTQRIHPATCSVVYRAGLFDIPEWFNTITNGDSALFVMIAHCGFFGYIDRVLATYRIHSNGVWSGADNLSRQVMSAHTSETLNLHYRNAYAHYFRVQQRYLSIARSFQQNGNTREAKRYFRKALSLQSDTSLTIGQVVKAFVAIYMPSLLAFYKRLRLPANRSRPDSST